MESNTTFTPSPWRWLVLLLFSLNNASNAFLWISFSPIVVTTAQGFQVSQAAVNWLSLVFLVLFFPGTLLTSFAIDRYGTRWTLIIASCLNCLGAWLRYIGLVSNLSHSGGFAIALVGQSLASMAQPTFTNMPARLSSDWFPAKERDTGTVIAALSNALGTAAASVVPSLVVSTPGDLPALLLGQAIATSAIFVLTAGGVRSDGPPTPPSASAAARLSQSQQQHHRRKPSAEEPLVGGEGGGAGQQLAEAEGGDHPPPTLTSTFRTIVSQYATLFRDRNFTSLMWGFGLGLGLFNAILTLLAQLISPCGYDDSVAGLVGGVLLGVGLVVAGFTGAVLEKTRAYVLILKCGMVCSFAASVFFLSSLRRGVDTTLVVSAGVLGGFLIPLLPVSLENAAECTYPLPEEVSAGLLLSVGNYIGLALTLGISAATPASCTTIFTPSAAVILGTLLTAVLSLLFFKVDYRRQKAERVSSLPAESSS